MNRIILIGNGFDLAHGLKTSYKDFIDDYWENKKTLIEKYGQLHHNPYDSLIYNPVAIIYEDDDIKIELYNPNYRSASHSSSLPEIIQSFFNNKGIKINMSYKNNFLKRIITAYENKNWCDIEDEYFSALKECITKKDEDKIDKLNQDFKKIKNELNNYLEQVNDNLNNYTLDFPIGSIIEKIYSTPEQITSILFLNFNYTSTHKFYTGEYNNGLFGSFDTEKIKNLKKEIIQIHGSIKGSNRNPIIFGYGDEKGKEYFEIENLNDNRFLENVKSIKYFETDNYKRLLNFIDSDKFQIFIMGHSCGISDRTLLSKLFEHNNCVSIKVFFHDKKEGTDDYSDVIRNISRNFDDKSVMREKVVNKMDSESLS